MRSLTGLIIVVLASILAPATAAAEMVSLSGQVTYRERVALPPGASLRIVLVDLTAAGSPAVVDVVAPIGSPGQVPLTFALSFDRLALAADHRHGLIAEIRAGEQVWFRNDPPFDLDPLSPTAPVVIITSPAATQPVDTTATAGVAATDGGASLFGVTWRAVEIRGAAVAPDVESTFSVVADSRVGGRGGCNNYFAQASVTGSSITLGAVAATRMACVSDTANAQETAFFEALAMVRNWRVGDDGMLVLVDQEGDDALRFTPAPR